ncbi:MAG: helix-turn-helix domain-containing protein [Verrucomicrobiales bacterium]
MTTRHKSRRPRSPKVHIGVFTRLETHYGQEIAAGVQRFGRADKRWSFCSVGHIDRLADLDWPSMDLDGLIAEFTGQEPGLLTRLRRTIPALIDVSPDPASPESEISVRPDHAAASRLAAAFFRRKGYRYFAYLGFRGSPSSSLHLSTFHGEGRKTPHAHLKLPAGYREDPTQLERLAAWLDGLEKGTAVLAANDRLAHHACLESGRVVPGDIAILGIGNEPAPPHAHNVLSSIDPGIQRVGLEAASCIDLMTKAGFRPEDLPARVTLISPHKVIERVTTGKSSLVDPLASEVFAFIEEHACSALTVSRIVEIFDVPRRTLERRFRRSMNTSLHQQILGCQLVEARRLLSETDLGIAEIATRSGFSEPRLLNIALKRETGMTPSAYRGKRGADPPATR